EALEFLLVWREIEGAAAKRHVTAFVHGEGDEADARIAIGIGLATGDGVGEPLLTVKAVPRGQDDVAASIEGGTRPERFLNRLGTGCGPNDLFQPLAAGRLTEQGDEL